MVDAALTEEVVALAQKLRALGVRRFRVGEVEVEFRDEPIAPAVTTIEDRTAPLTPEEERNRRIVEAERRLFHSSG